METPKPGLDNINKLYNKITFFDSYYGSFLQLSFITIVFVVVIVYCSLMSRAELIKKDWDNQRCNPTVMPFAGLINKPDGMSVNDFTKKNYADCAKTIQNGTTTMSTNPLNFIMGSLTTLMEEVKKSVNDSKGMVGNVSSSFGTAGDEIAERIKIIIVPIQQFILGLKDLISKTQATITASLYTFMGAFMTMKTLVGAIVELAIKILSIMVGVIVALWIAAVFFPFSAIAAGTMTALFVVITTTLITVIALMVESLKIHPSTGLPKLKCFDKDTIFTMNDGSKKRVIDIVVGDILQHNNHVTGKFKVESAGSNMYDLHNVLVSNSHIVKHGDCWIPVSEHPDAIRIAFYEQPFLYCMNTSSKEIHINGLCFTDWDEVFDDDLQNLKDNARLHDITEIHSRLGSGFVGHTAIKLNDGTVKELRRVQVGDVLEHGNRVYGIVQIDGLGLFEQCKYKLLDNTFVDGGVNLCVCDERVMVDTTLDIVDKKPLITKHRVLYHLLTNTDTFFCNGIRFHDYNASIDLFLDKNKGRILAMNHM